MNIFEKQKCAGCRKFKRFVKHRRVNSFKVNETLTTMDKLCFSCGRKLKKIMKVMNK